MAVSQDKLYAYITRHVVVNSKGEWHVVSQDDDVLPQRILSSEGVSQTHFEGTALKSHDVFTVVPCAPLQKATCQLSDRTKFGGTSLNVTGLFVVAVSCRKSARVRA